MRPRRFTPCALTLTLLAGLGPAAGADEGAALGDVKSWSKIGDGVGGFTLPLDNDDLLGFDVARIGDLNDDGVDDLAVGAYGDDDGGDRRGAVYVLFMKKNGQVAQTQKISDTQGGFNGVLGNVDWFGCSLEGLGDLDGDGVEDLAVGAALDDDGNTNRGAIWILFLNADGTVKGHTKISDWSGGFGGSMWTNGRFGQSIANLGDLNDDGVIDLAVGASRHGDGGAVWILFLNANGTVKSYNFISSFAGGFSGAVEADSEFGYSVTGLGDIDGDNVEDLAVGARRACHGTVPSICNIGAVWVLRMNGNGSVKAQQKIGVNVGGWPEFHKTYDFLGSGVSAIGDLDGDGVTDLAIGCEQDDDGGSNDNASNGAVYLCYLNADGTAKGSHKISATAGGFDAAIAEGDRFGCSVRGLGDFDGDGVPDLFVGAWGDNGQGTNSRGAAYLLNLANPLEICVESVPNAEVGVEYDRDLQFIGAAPPLVGQVTKGALPAGLSLVDGEIVGTPTKPGKASFTVTLSDAIGRSVKRAYTMKVKKALAWKTKSLADAAHGKPYKQSLELKGGEGPFSFGFGGAGLDAGEGALPDGLEIDDDKAKLVGTPREVGSWEVTIFAYDELGGEVQQTFPLIVKSTLKVSTKKLKKAKAGKPYAQTVKAKGGWIDEKKEALGEEEPGYDFAVVDGEFPAGLSLAADGSITGTPTTKGTAVFTVRVTDDSGETAERELSIKVK